MSRKLRIFILLSLLAIEVALLLSFENRGWVATNTSLVWLRAIGIGVVPIAIGALIFFRNGRRFSLKSLFVLVSCIAIFLVFTLSPLLNARRDRQAARQLLSIGADLKTESYTDAMFERLNLPPDEMPMVLPAQVPQWLHPVAGSLLNVPVDGLVAEITIDSEQQMDILLANASRLVGLRTIVLTGPGIRHSYITNLSHSVSSFPFLRNLTSSESRFQRIVFRGLIA